MTIQAPSTLQAELKQFFDAYPHLQSIVSQWGTQAGRDRIASLIMDTRDGKRQGFPTNHAQTLLRLLMEHDGKFPEYEPKQKFDWAAGALDGRLDRRERGF